MFDFTDVAADNPTFYADLDEPQSLNKYQYCYNNPLAYVDPDGHSVWTKLVKAIVKTVKTGSAVEAFRDNINDIKTVADSKQSGWRRVGAAASVASELLPVSVGDVKDGVGLARSGLRRLRGTGNASDAARSALRNSDEAAGTAKQLHKNSKEYVGDSHVYQIKGPDGTTYKIGESSQGTRKRDGASKRAESQVRKLTRETGQRYQSRIIRRTRGKAESLKHERKLIERFRRRYGEDALPGNKSYH